MSRKNIISDFSALKGKVVFSENPSNNNPSNNKMSPKVTVASAETPKVSERWLDVGQSVVLMDSNLRGRIVGLGKTVKIELEDGLIIESAYGEFAVTDKTEIDSLKNTKIKAKKAKAVTHVGSTNSNGCLTIDLHIEAIPGGINVPKGQQLQFQMETFRKIIRNNLSHRGMKITFIHGIGDGILRAAIRKELDEVLALRCRYSIGDPAVTVVHIR